MGLPMTTMRDRLAAMLDHPRLFNLVQLVTCGNQSRTRRMIRDGLQIRPGERLLDVCCGTGEFADLAAGPYLGVDINARYVEYAQRRHGVGAGHPECVFLVQDVTREDFGREHGVFPKAMFVNGLHHLDDGRAGAVLAAIARATDGRVVIVDMDPAPGRAVSRWLAGLDRGRHIRPLADQVALAARFFNVEASAAFYSGVWGQAILVCTTRR